jgi:hypothetical protein
LQSIATFDLIEAVPYKIFRLRKTLDEYEHLLPESTCPEFLRGIRCLIDAVEESHNGWRDAFQHARTNKSRAALDRHLRTSSLVSLRTLSNIHQKYLPFLHSATDQSSFLLRPILDRALSIIGRGSPSELVLVPRFEYTYGFTGLVQFVTREIRKLQYASRAQKAERLRLSRTLPKITAFISYPVIDKSSALKLAAIVHELAHFFNYLERIHNRILNLDLTLDKTSFDALQQKYESVELAAGRNPSKDEVEAECFESCQDLLSAWLEETVADVIATRILGPAYLFSFLEFLGDAGKGNQSDSEHPAPAKRLEVIVRELETLGYLSSKHSLKSELISIRKKVTKESATTQYDDKENVVHRTLESHWSEILNLIRRSCDQYSYPATQYNRDVPPVRSKLLKAVCPIETVGTDGDMVPASAIAVLNATWEVYKLKLSDFQKLFIPELSKESIINDLNQLTFKALEGTEILRRWKELTP